MNFHKSLRILIALGISFFGRLLYADELTAQPKGWPFLGVVLDGKVYVPVFGDAITDAPSTVIGYPSDPQKLAKSSAAGFALRLIPLEHTAPPGSLVASDKGFGAAHALVYEAKPVINLSNTQFLILFDQDPNLKWSDKKKRWLTVNFKTGYRLVEATSQEGGHYVVQTYSGSKCIRGLDYYLYAGYDTESDSDVVLKKALCDTPTDPSELQF